MRINSSNYTLSSSEISATSHQTDESLRAWNSSGELKYASDSDTTSSSKRRFSTQDIVELQTRSIPKMPLPLPETNTEAPADTANDLLKDEFSGTIRDHMIKSIVEAMTGKKIHVYDPASSGESDELTLAEDTPESGAAPVELQGWGIDYQYHEITTTTEGFTFATQGTITTEDGRSITFGAALEMSRQTYDEISISLKAGDALIDPLVIDFTGRGASLADSTVAFDLNADGTAETMHTLADGRGFLALDRNNNGSIDDGSELFGPSSGNGFNELALLDDDSNGWIDENDAAFGDLRIWQIASEESQSLTTLLQNGIGALATGRAATSYALQNNSSVTGVIRESSIFLRENGGAGFVQEIDIAV